MQEEDFIDFLKELKDKLEGIKAIVKKYGVEDFFAMSFIGGLYNEGEEGELKFSAVTDFVVEDEEELDEVLSAALEIYRMTEGMTADEDAELPESMKDTKDWDSEDWMKFISKNTKDDKSN